MFSTLLMYGSRFRQVLVFLAQEHKCYSRLRLKWAAGWAEPAMPAQLMFFLMLTDFYIEVLLTENSARNKM